MISDTGQKQYGFTFLPLRGMLQGLGSVGFARPFESLCGRQFVSCFVTFLHNSPNATQEV